MRVGVLLAAAALAVGCGGAKGAQEERVTVFAAASLAEALEPLAREARFNFAGSDELATQIREGARADVYAAASLRHPDELHAEGLVDEPSVFATNRLVIVLPAANPAGVGALADLGREGMRLVVGAEGVPVGDYTREALGAAGRGDVLARVVSEEEDVKGVLGKVLLGEADAGFVYATDARAAGDRVRTLDLPPAVTPEIRYAVAVVRQTEHRDAADAFVRLLLSGRGRELLLQAGFGLP